MLLLGLSRWGFRKVVYIIIAMVSVIGLAYVYEAALVSPNWSQVGLHLVIPQVTSASILTAVSILGATVMPHNVFLHSFLASQRVSSSQASVQEQRKVLRLAKIDTLAALNVAFFVNAAMLAVAVGGLFHTNTPAPLYF